MSNVASPGHGHSPAEIADPHAALEAGADAAQAAVGHAAEHLAVEVDKGAALTEYVLGHVANSYEWHLPFGVHINLPPWLSLHALMLVIVSTALVALFSMLYRRDRVPSGLTNLLETLIVFVRDDICIPNLGKEDGRRLAPLILTFFFFILGLNLIGLIPIFATATGNVNVTGALALITLSMMIFGAILKNGIGGFIGTFIPHGVPLPVLVILTPIEFIGIFIKAFALMIRLFANLLAGHIALFCIIGLLYVVGIAALPALGMAVGIYCLEIFVAFLQAYVFSLLSAMFIGMMLHPEH